MNRVEFLFDTADISYIDGVWTELRKHVEPTAVRGITTNPNALSKINCMTLEDLEREIPKLVTAVSDMREGEPGGTVHVQFPASSLSNHYQLVSKWAEYISGFGDGCTHIVMKIPHFTGALKLTEHVSHIVPINVTGISDWGTILKAFAFSNVTYASLIPGRMEEVEINADETMMYLQGIPRQGIQKVIAGSMRTIEGLANSVAAGLLPTIGTRVWDLFHNGKVDWGFFPEMWQESEWDDKLYHLDMHWPPLITEDHRQLTVDFFEQMDQLGEQMAREFVSKVIIADSSKEE